MQAATIDAPPADFQALALRVREAGLLAKRPGYYRVKIGLTIAVFVGAWVAFVVVGDSWATLAIAAVLGVTFMQLGFIGHDAGHQQVFDTRRGNRLLGLAVGNALIGLSFGWWVPKHCAHHAHPNEVGRDPDVGAGLGEGAAAEDGAVPGWWAIRLLARWQAHLFFPLMLLRSAGLHVSGIWELAQRRGRAAAVEGLLLVVHAVVYLTMVFVVLSPLKALAFIAVQQAVFSVYLGCSFAPNHKAMPLVPPGARVDFARRQVLTAMNVTGSAFVTLLLGGLNFQIEHHLFPAMPRPNLRRAQCLVREFCTASGLAYCEVGLAESFRLIIRHLRAQEATSAQDRGAT